MLLAHLVGLNATGAVNGDGDGTVEIISGLRKQSGADLAEALGFTAEGN